MKTIFIFLTLTAIAFSSYKVHNRGVISEKNNSSDSGEYNKGEYGYDLEFLRKHLNPVELINCDSRLIVEPEYQGRVMTSTSSGLRGYSYGWINYNLISSSKTQEHFNPYGGEERIWLGPEGGQFAIFFNKGAEFNLKNWYVPAVLDIEPFEVAAMEKNSVTMTKQVKLVNYSGTVFDAEITRKVTLLGRDKIMKSLGRTLDSSISVVAYQSENRLKNTGKTDWNKEVGALSIWMLSMLNPSTDVTIILPYKSGEYGRVVKDDYFGTIPKNRLKVSDNAVFFLGDGKFRSKIGISPQRALPVIGSYDGKNNILTLIEFTIPGNKPEYVNSALEIQKEPFQGDVINSYNDGPTDGTQLGPFYELEISSPAAFLKPGEEIVHTQKIYHLGGSKKDLNEFSKSFLKVSLEEVVAAFKN